MKKSIITASLLAGMSLFAQPSNVASLTDVKESVYYLLKDYKDVKNRLEVSELKIKNLEETLNKKNLDEKSNYVKSKKTTNSGKEDQIILDYLNQNKNN